MKWKYFKRFMERQNRIDPSIMDTHNAIILNAHDSIMDGIYNWSLSRVIACSLKGFILAKICQICKVKWLICMGLLNEHPESLFFLNHYDLGLLNEHIEYLLVKMTNNDFYYITVLVQRPLNFIW